MLTRTDETILRQPEARVWHRYPANSELAAELIIGISLRTGADPAYVRALLRGA